MVSDIWFIGLVGNLAFSCYASSLYLLVCGVFLGFSYYRHGQGCGYSYTLKFPHQASLIMFV